MDNRFFSEGIDREVKEAGEKVEGLGLGVVGVGDVAEMGGNEVEEGREVGGDEVEVGEEGGSEGIDRKVKEAGEKVEGLGLGIVGVGDVTEMGGDEVEEGREVGGDEVEVGEEGEKS